MNQNLPNSFRSGPDQRGHFGIFGGRFVAETLMPLILDLEKAYADAKADPAFQAEMNGYLRDYVGRPSPLYLAERLTEHLGGAKIYFKREELNHTGSHKVNNVLGQIMVARRMGKKRIIAETGAGQHGVATATLCARFGLECFVYMGAVDVERQQPNVIRMEMLGAKVVPVQSGTRTLKDAMNEALRDWVTNVHNTFYCIGTVAGPHPYPMMVRDFQSVIGEETRQQMQEAEGRLPDSLVACIGGGSNAMGLFHPFLDDPSVEIFGVEAAGHGLTQQGELGLRISEVGDHLHHAAPGLADSPRDGDQFVLASAVRRRQLAVDAPVVERARRGEAERARCHCFSRQPRHLGRLLGSRLCLRGGPAAHDLNPERRVRHLSSQVDVIAAAGQHAEIIGERLPVPGQSFAQRRAGDVLDAFHKLDQAVPVLGPDWREANPAVPHHDCRDAVPR